MNQKQIAIREFFEQVLLERMEFDRIENLQEIISARVFDGESTEETFCDYFDLGEGMIYQLETQNFPFLTWWNDYCKNLEEL